MTPMPAPLLVDAARLRAGAAKPDLRTVLDQLEKHLLQAPARAGCRLVGQTDGHRVGHHEQAQIDGFDFLRGDRRR